VQLFAQIHEICFYGKGGYDWHTVYDMPLWLRRFTHSKMVEHYEEEKKAYNKASGKGSSTSRSLTTDGKVTAPEFLKGNSPPKSHIKSVPNYSTKASKK
tara:strand:+ start:559 stop:855 length:297 start_codon:yes stop_codon:yes gene_type:complete